jgi:membrane-associated phospholipid phosphatase
LLSYNLIPANFPFVDSYFHKIDSFLNYNWIEWYKITNSYNFLSQIFLNIYLSIQVQTIMTLVLLSFLRQSKNLRLFIFLFLTCSLVTLILSTFFPAIAAYTYYGITPEMLKNVYVAAPYLHVDHVLQLRAGTLTAIDFGNVQGLVTFPSFHASLGVIFILVNQHIPYWRWFMFILNLAMIFITPIQGGHYWVDVLAGCAIAFAFYYIAMYIYSKEEAKEPTAEREAKIGIIQLIKEKYKPSNP